MTTHPVSLGPELFAFASRAEWVRRAQKLFLACGHHPRDVVCIDAAGRICTIGKHFSRAEAEGAFPVRAYAVEDAEVERNATSQGVTGANARLIAAAPDLLHACELAIEALQDLPGREPHPDITAIQAAVSKATTERKA